MSATFIQDPNEDLDYEIDWSAQMAADTDTILTSTWDTITGLTAYNTSATTTNTVVWIKGGTLNTSYSLTNHIVTAGGRKYDQTLTFVIKAQ